MGETKALTVTNRAPMVTPTIWAMLEAIAGASHESRKFGVATRGEAAMKFLFCFENGLALSTANTGLYVVNGRLAAQSNIIAAQIRRHPEYDYRVKRLDDKGCTIEILRLGEDGKLRAEGEASFTEEDAKRARLLDKDNYQGYPSDMYFNRALARAQKRYAPDIFSQPVYTPEELGLRTDGEGEVVESSWREVMATSSTPATEPTESTPAIQAPPAPVITIDDLLKAHGAEKIIAVNEGRIPGTLEEIAEVAARLEVGDGKQ